MSVFSKNHCVAVEIVQTRLFLATVKEIIVTYTVDFSNKTGK